MNKHLFLAVAAAAAIGYGCSSDELDGARIVEGNDLIVATLDDSDTRTYLDETSPNTVRWAQGDKISVFSTKDTNVKSKEYTLNGVAGGTSAEFKGSTPTGYEKKALLYPYSDDATYSPTDNKITYPLTASAYTYTKENPTYTNGAPMAALYSEDGVTFRHAGAVIDFEINNVPAGYTTAKLVSEAATGGTAAKVSGTAEITFANGVPTLKIADSDTDGGTEAIVTFASSSESQNIRMVFPLPVATYGKLTLKLGGSTDNGVTELTLDSWTNINATRGTRIHTVKAVDSVTGSVQTEVSNVEDVTAALKNSTAVVVDLSKSTDTTSGGTTATVTLPDHSTSTTENTDASTGQTVDETTPVSLTLSNVSSSHSIEIKESTSSDNTAVKTSTDVTVAASTASGTDAITALTVTLPSSTVTLEAKEESVTYTTVTASTAENTLKVGNGVTITTLKVAKGNVYLKKGATITTIERADNYSTTDTSAKTKIYKEAGATITNTPNSSNFEVIDVTHVTQVQNFLSGNTNDSKFTLTEDLTLEAPLVVEAGSALTLDLAGHSITPKNATLTGPTVKDGSSTKVSTAVDALLLVRRGAHLILQDSKGNGSIHIKDDNNSSIYAAVKMTISEDSGTDAAKLTVEGGTLKGYYYAITGHGSRHNTEINIKGGTLNTYITDDGCAIYHPQDGTLNVSGGEIAGPTGIEMRAGTLNVTGGSIQGTYDPKKVEANGSGTTTTGAAIAVAQHTTKKAISVKISAGTIKGADYALYESNPQSNGADDIAKVQLSVTGGTLEGKIYSEDCQSFIFGGTFSDLTTTLPYATGSTTKAANIKISQTQALTDLDNLSKAVNLTLDLNKQTVTPSTWSKISLASADYKVTLKNGTIQNKTNTSIDNHGLVDLGQGIFELQNFTIDTDKFYAALMGQLETLKLTVTGSTLRGKYFGVGSNASTNSDGSLKYGSGANIIFKNTVLESDETGIMNNVPVKVSFQDCTFKGNHQGALLRGGTYEFKGNNTIELVATYSGSTGANATSECKNGTTWGTGNQTPFAPLVIGNDPESGAYQYTTTVDFLSGTTTVKTSGTYAANFPGIYVSAHASYAVTIDGLSDHVTFDSSITYPNKIEYYTDNITVDGTAKSAADNASASN